MCKWVNIACFYRGAKPQHCHFLGINMIIFLLQPPASSALHVVLPQTLAVRRSSAVSRGTVTRRCRERTRTAARMRRRTAVTRRSVARRTNVVNLKKGKNIL